MTFGREESPGGGCEQAPRRASRVAMHASRREPLMWREMMVRRSKSGSPRGCSKDADPSVERFATRKDRCHLVWH